VAGDINIPGDELREAQNNLTFVHDFIDIDRNAFDFEAAFGPDLGNGAAKNFEDRWDDGQTQLKKQIVGVRDAIGSILDSFEQTDLDAVANLDNGQG
jgi:hypothetical protein